MALADFEPCIVCVIFYEDCMICYGFLQVGVPLEFALTLRFLYFHLFTGRRYTFSPNAPALEERS